MASASYASRGRVSSCAEKRSVRGRASANGGLESARARTIFSQGLPQRERTMSSPSPHVYNVGASDFAARVLEASHERLVLVDFWAGWCQPCRILAPLLERVVDDYGGRVQLAKVEIDQEAELAERFRIQSIPHVKAFRDGREVDGFVGVVPESEIRRLIDRHAPDPDAAALEEIRALARRGQRAEAIARLEPLVAARPRSRLAFELADLLLDQGKSAEARSLFSTLRPEDADEEAYGRLAARLAFARVLEHPEEAPHELTEAARAVFAGLVDEALETLLAALPTAGDEDRSRIREAFLEGLRLLPDEDARAAWRRRLARLLH